MKNTVKRLVNFRFDRYKDMEIKLEKMAAKGLFLYECQPFLWTFRKGEPKSLKYTVTYFSEASLFNPNITDNQQSYIEYAKAAGWDFIAQFNQMQIFCSETENTIPFETDEQEKLENIKKCMKKSFIPSLIALIVIYSLNFALQFSSLFSDSIDFLSDANRLYPNAMFVVVVIYSAYFLIDYIIWCKRSKKAIANGGACIEKTGRASRIVDIIILCFIFGSLGLFLFHQAAENNWLIILIGIVQVPIFFFVFYSSIKYLKKKNVTAMMNRAISLALLCITCFAYLGLMLLFIIKFDLNTGHESAYRNIAWNISPMETYDYKLYSDEIPLTCEDLYGPIAYDYYSYEKTVDSTIFLNRSNYRQEALPAEDPPPRLEYEILEPRFDSVYKLVRENLLTIPDWAGNTCFKPIDNEIFGTIEVYQKYYEDSPTGKYTLFFEDKIITLNMEEAPSHEQVLIIKEKLQF